MPDHEWGDSDDEGAENEVRRIQPYEAVKTYRCPGCDHEIRVGEGHVVVVPRLAPDDRRHWHHACWARAERGGRGPIRRSR